jgi:hypothetical protein
LLEGTSVAFDGREGAREKLEGFCQVLEEALVIAHKDLDRLILARELMNRVTAQCRSNSKLPELVELFLSRPLVTVPLEAKLLEVTPKSIDLMLIELGGALPHELTGRTRYCAWASFEATAVFTKGLNPPLCSAAHPLWPSWLTWRLSIAPDGRHSMASATHLSAHAAHTPSFGTALMRFAVAFPLMTATMVLLSAISG